MNRWTALLLSTAGLLMARPAAAQEAGGGGEASLRIPDLNSVKFLSAGIPGHTLLLTGLVVCALGLLFGLVIYSRLKRLPVHEAMREVSELIYETCKTYLITQGKFLMLLWVFIGAIAAVYFGFLAQTTDAAGAVVRGFPAPKVAVILLFSLIGIAGSYSVAWFGIRVTPSPTPGPRSRASGASRTPATRSRSARG